MTIAIYFLVSKFKKRCTFIFVTISRMKVAFFYSKLTFHVCGQEREEVDTFRHPCIETFSFHLLIPSERLTSSGTNF